MVSCEVQEFGINKYVVYSAGQGIMTVISRTCKHSLRCLFCTECDKVPQSHGTNSLRTIYTERQCCIHADVLDQFGVEIHFSDSLDVYKNLRAK